MANDLVPLRLHSVFVPPHPARPARSLPLLALWRTAKRNPLAIWPRAAFEKDVLGRRLWLRDVVVCNSPDSIHYALVERHENFQRKSPQHRHARRPLVGDGLLLSDGVLWRERRRVVAPLTHASRLPELAPVISAAAARRRESWRRRCAAGPIDVLAEMEAFAAEVVCRTVFGHRLGAELAPVAAAALAAYQASIDHADLLSMLGLPDWLPRWHGVAPRLEARRLHAAVDARIAAILDGEPDEPSLIRDMAATRVPEADHRMDRRAFRNEAVTLLLAGCGTTASLVAWALYLLSQDRMSAVRLRREVDAVLGDRVAGLDDLPHLPFTAAVLDETARLFPPVPLLSREALGPDRIGPREVRRGSIVLACPWLLHRRPSLWEEPDAFIPDRFLPGAPKPERYAYIPFGVGPRLCAGQHLGLATAAIGLATLAGSFALRLEPGTAVMPVARLTLRPGEALPMRLTPRRG